MKRLYYYEPIWGGIAVKVLWFYIYVYRGGMWFRLFGYGLIIENRKVIPALFSERNGYTKVLRLGKWSIKGLKP